MMVPAIATIVMLAILIGLGVWQLQRLQWKLGLLAEIDRAEAAPPVPLPDHPLQFTKVTVSGHFRDDLHALYGADVRDVPGGTAMGAQLIVPLERPGQDPILVDRGWVPDGPTRPARRRCGSRGATSAHPIARERSASPTTRRHIASTR